MRSIFAAVVLVSITTLGTASAQVCDLEVWDSVEAPGSLANVVTFGEVAYVAAETAGIVSINIRSPALMEVVGNDPTVGIAHDIILEYFNNLLVVADDTAGVGVYKIESGGTISHQETTSLGETIITVAGVTGRFLAGSEEGTLFTVTLGGGNAPELQASLALGGQVVGIAETLGTAYCALGSANEIAIVDTGDSDNPTLLGRVPTSGAVLSITRSGNEVLCGVAGVGLVAYTIEGDTLVEGETLQLTAAPTSIYAWNNQIYMAIPDYGVVGADTSLGTGILQIAELELPESVGLALAGDVAFVARGELDLTSLNLRDCSTSGGTPTTRVIPAAARAVGAANSFWVTDVAIANFTTGVASYNIAYLAANQSNTVPLNTTLAIGPGQQVILGDVFFSVFGLESANGALRIITSDPDVKITSRTYNAAGLEGTYGQFIPALDSGSATEPGSEGVLLQLQQNSDFRTNVGMVNIAEEPVQVEIHLYDGDGTHLGVHGGEQTLLEPYEMIQIGRIFTRVGANQVDSGYAIVRVLSNGGMVQAYASVVDQGSNDPIYIPTQAVVEGFAH